MSAENDPTNGNGQRPGAFEWSHFQPVTLRELARALGLDARSAEESLKGRYGSPPGDDFVVDAWHHLRDSWLARDRISAEVLSKRLADCNVGNTLLRLTSHEKRLAYLQTCRLSKTVRREALAVLLAAGSEAPPRQLEESDIGAALGRAEREGRPLLRTSSSQSPAPPAAPAPTVEPTSPAAPSQVDEHPLVTSEEDEPEVQYIPPHLRPSDEQPARSSADTTIESQIENQVSAHVSPAAAAMPPVVVAVAGITTEFDQGLHHVIRAALTSLGDDETRWIVPSAAGAEWWASGSGPTAMYAHTPRETGSFTVTDIDITAPLHVNTRRDQQTLMSRLSATNLANGIASCVVTESTLEFRIRLCTYRQAEHWQVDLAATALVSAAASGFDLAQQLQLMPASGALGTRAAPSEILEDALWRVSPASEHQHQIPALSGIRQLLLSTPGVRIDDRGSDENSLRATHPGPNLAFERRFGPLRKKSDDQEIRVALVDHQVWGTGLQIELEVPSDMNLGQNENLAFQANAHEWRRRDDMVLWGGWGASAQSLRLVQFLPRRLFGTDPDHNVNLAKEFVLYSIRRGNGVASEVLRV